MKAKLIELGYLEKDMLQLSTLSVVDKDTELTDLSKFFYAHREIFVDDIIQAGPALVRLSRIMCNRSEPAV